MIGSLAKGMSRSISPHRKTRNKEEHGHIHVVAWLEGIDEFSPAISHNQKSKLVR